MVEEISQPHGLKDSSSVGSRKSLFLYFGTIVIRFVIEESLPWREVILWSSPAFFDKPLKELKPSEHKLFIGDLQALTCAKFLPKVEVGKFVKITETAEHIIYVYEHVGHCSFSSMGFTSVATLAEVKEEKKILLECSEHSNHDYFLPFLYGNGQLKEMLSMIIRKHDGHRKKAAQELINDKVIFGSLQEDCSSYDEDTWTMRLCRCLEYASIKHTFTGKLRGRAATEEAMMGRKPECVDFKCFVFRGCPDIIIETQSEDGVVAIKDERRDDDAGVEDTDGDSDGSTDGSTGSGRIQMEFQMLKTRPYKVNSFVPIKAGEVVGAIHMGLVAKALRNYVDGKFTNDMYIGHGLFIHKVTGVVHIKVVLSNKPMKVHCNRLIDGNVTTDLVCSTMSYFLKHLTKKGSK